MCERGRGSVPTGLVKKQEGKFSKWLAAQNIENFSAKYFDTNYMRRLHVLPGMTGLLQINDRNTNDFKVWFKHDIEYIENWNFYLDLKILLKTIPSLFNKSVQGK